jgi:hypothetical protein
MLASFKTTDRIDWAAKGIARRLQNISNSLNTMRYEVAYDRTLGRDPDNQDKPLDKYIAAVVAETYELVPEIDPGVKVIEVIPTYENDELSLEVVVELE